MGEPKLESAELDSGSKNSDSLPPPQQLAFKPVDKKPGLLRRLLPYAIFLVVACALFRPVEKAIVNFLEFETTDDASIAGNMAIVSAKVGGVITNVYFEDHATVKKGDLLVQLDQREFQNTIKQLQADIAAATAQYEAAKRELERGQFDNIVERRRNELDSEQALLKEAKIDWNRGEFDTIVKRRKRELEAGTALLDEAKQTFRRIEELRNKKLISEVEFDTAKTSYNNNVAKVGALQVQLKEAELAAERSKEAAEAKFLNLESKRKVSQVSLREALKQAESAQDVANANVQATLARIWSLQAQLDQAKLNLEYSQIRAADNGIVSRRNVQPGMVIKPNQPLTMLMSSTEKWVIANFKETQLKDIYVGQPVEIEIDAIHGRTFVGAVQSISPGSGSTFALIPPDNATGNFTKVVQRVPIKIVFDRKSIAGVEDILIPGISVFVKARIRKK